MAAARRETAMKIAKIGAFRLYPKVIKEAWVEDEYVWPSQPPSFLIKATSEDGSYGIGEVTSQTWYLGETAAQIAAAGELLGKGPSGPEPANLALAHHPMGAPGGGGLPGGRP